MNNDFFRDCLIAHAKRYPQMQPRDAVKLAYQSEFGGGHMIADAAASLAYLQRELETVTPGNAVLAEPIGDGKVRVHLSALGSISAQTLNRAFVASANRAVGTMAGLEEKLACITALCEQGEFVFSPSELTTYLADYRAVGCPAVSHSEAYRSAYHPAYRVIDARFVPLLPLMEKIEAALQTKNAVRVAIDGMAASGKSTAAELLQTAFDAAIIHMDDFFLPIPLRTPERLAEPGGNVDYERFAQEVAKPLAANQPIAYGVFDCSVMAVTHTCAVAKKPVTIVEGSYSHHPHFGEYVDLTAFCFVPSAVQRERILARNGEAMWQRFRDAWIPMENRYFEAFDIAKNADVTIQTA